MKVSMEWHESLRQGRAYSNHCHTSFVVGWYERAITIINFVGMFIQCPRIQWESVGFQGPIVLSIFSIMSKSSFSSLVSSSCLKNLNKRHRMARMQNLPKMHSCRLFLQNLAGKKNMLTATSGWRLLDTNTVNFYNENTTLYSLLDYLVFTQSKYPVLH